MAFRKSRVTIHVKSVTFLHAGKIFILFSIPRPYGSALRRKKLSKLRFPSGSGGTAAGGISPAATNLCSWLAAGQRPAPYDFRLSSFQYPAASGKTVHFPACIFPLECYIMCICTHYKETIRARTKKCRRVCCRPACRRFQAESAEHSVELLLDELEAMRLVDLEQMEQVKKMGGMADILNMIPGMSKQLRGVEIDDGMLDKTANIIYSMTKEERENPKIINPSRKRRIANGAGVPIAEVNKLCKNFEESQKMMKQMSGMFGGKKGRRGRKGKFPFPF